MMLVGALAEVVSVGSILPFGDPGPRRQAILGRGRWDADVRSF